MYQPIKNHFDISNYEKLSLLNELSCLLISNQKIDLSSLCLTISIGALEDPLNCQGLAHFLEHFLFSGSKKFPDPNEFSTFLLNNSGTINTATDLNTTSFYFECNSSVFESGIERFISYFLDPLFDEKQIEKCVQIVNNEFNSSKTNDYYKNLQIFRNMANKSHQFNKFGMGNKDSLKSGNQLLNLSKDFFEKYYSANIMSLSVYSKHDQKSLEELITKHFGQIPNKKINLPLYKEIAFEKENLCKIIKVESQKEINEMTLIWVLPYLIDENFNKSRQYLWYIINFGGSGSLLSNLRQNDLANDLSFKYINYFECFDVCEMKIKLTEKGFKNYESIIQIIFSLLKLIETKGILQQIYDEAQKLSILNFHYNENVMDMNILIDLSKKIKKNSFETLLVNDFLWKKFDENLIKNQLNLLKSENLLIFLNSKNFNNLEKFEIQKNFNCKFYCEEFSIKIIENLVHDKFNLDIIPPNIYVPKNAKFNDFSIDEENYNGNLEKILENEKINIYYKYDKIFKLPKSSGRLRIVFGKNIEKNAIFQTFLNIFVDLIVFFLVEEVALIQRAHGKFNLYSEENALILSFEGFSETLLIMIEKIRKTISNVLNGGKLKEIFEGLKKKYLDLNINYLKSDPWNISDYLFKNSLMVSCVFEKEEIIKNLEKTSFDDFEKFLKNEICDHQLIWFFYGDINKTDLLNYFKNFPLNIFNNTYDKILPKEEISKLRVIKLPKNTTQIFEYILSEEIASSISVSCLLAYWQYGSDTAKNRVLSYLLTYLLSEQIYSNLSLGGKYGYSENGYDILRGTIGYKIKISSKNSCSHHLSEQINELLSKLKEKVVNISDKIFEDLKNIVLMGITSENNSKEEEFENNWMKISRNEFEINRDFEEKNELQKINKKDLENFYCNLFENKKKKIEIHVSNKSFLENNDFQRVERLKAKKENINILKNFDKLKSESKIYKYYY